MRYLIKELCANTIPRNWVMWRGPRRSNAVALTFDDGPHPRHTPSILDLLAAHDIRATFFVQGNATEQYPDLVRRIKAEGHTIGQHTWSHPRPWKIDWRGLVREVTQTRDLVEQLTGVPCNLFRPPWGHLSMPKLLALWHSGQKIVLWNVDPRDWYFKGTEAAGAWSERYLPRGGDVVLMHDDHEHTLHLLDRVIQQCRKVQVGFASINDWLASAKEIPRDVASQPLTSIPLPGRIASPTASK